MQFANCYTKCIGFLLFLQNRRKVTFQRGDACNLPLDIGEFGCVLAANLVCRLHSPNDFLDRLPNLVAHAGILVITSPYTFLKQFTPRVSLKSLNLIF